MANDSPLFETHFVRPPTEEEIEFLGIVAGISFVVAVIGFLVVVTATSVVAAKTTLPGRRSVLASVLLLPAFWAYEQFMGGSLELTFGPVALLVSTLVYAAFAVLFSQGLSRMCFHFVRSAQAAGMSDRGHR